MLGISLLEKVSWFLGFSVLAVLDLVFVVSWLLGFRVAWFLGFEVSKFLGFKVSKIHNCHFMFLKKHVSRIPYYPTSIS